MNQVFRHVSWKYVKSVVVIALFVLAGILLAFSSHVYAANTYSINLNGSSQYLSISDASQTGLDLTGDFTVEAWIKLTSQPSGDAYYVLGKYDFDNNNRSYALSYDSSNHLGCSVSHDGSTAGTASISQALSTGTWYHVAAVYTSSNGNCEIYLNGASIGSSTTQSGGPLSGNAAFTIGGLLGNSPGFYFSGKIDEVRVFNTARSAIDIASDYNQELTGSETGLVGYWKLNNSLADATSNSNTLTNNSSATFSTDTPFVVPAPVINSFTADPSTISSGATSTLMWDVTNVTSLTIDNSIGSVGSSTVVSPTVTTTYTLTASNQGYATTTAQVTVTVSAAPTAVRKSANESVTNSTTLQNDDHLSLQLTAGKTYIVEGLIVASSSSATPDIKIAFTSPASSEMAIGYSAIGGTSASGGLLQSAAGSARITLPANTATPILIHGTMLAGASGTLRLQWAQFTSNANAVVVGKGSYLKVTEL